MELVWVPERGADGGFWMGKYEVTQEQYEAVMGKNPSNFKGAKNPVETVSWNDATDFCRKASQKTGGTCSLPSVAQWTYACLAGETGDYGFAGGAGQLGDYAWYDGNSGNTTHPVGQKKPNAWGLYDMHGNVWEWCEDEEGSGTGTRALRGGGWSDDAGSCRASYRYWLSPADADYDRGFRVDVSVRTRS
jgi:formylglycine-generating enzyme required for sulfatase activity